VQHFVDRAGRQPFQNKWAVTAIGPVTAGALRKAGFQDILIAEDTTADAVIATLEKHFARSGRRCTTGASRP
jgi:uroporphyrinogen-III synthase